jgi:hypothetical protein
LTAFQEFDILVSIKEVAMAQTKEFHAYVPLSSTASDTGKIDARTLAAFKRQADKDGLTIQKGVAESIKLYLRQGGCRERQEAK